MAMETLKVDHLLAEDGAQDSARGGRLSIAVPAGMAVVTPGNEFCYTRVVTKVDVSLPADDGRGVKASLLAVDNENALYAVVGTEIRKRTHAAADGSGGKVTVLPGSKGVVGPVSLHMSVDVHKHVWVTAQNVKGISKITSSGNSAVMDFRSAEGKDTDMKGIKFGDFCWCSSSDKEGNVYVYDNHKNVRLIPYVPLKPHDYPVVPVTAPAPGAADSKTANTVNGLADFEVRAMVHAPTPLMKDKANVAPQFVFSSRWSVLRAAHATDKKTGEHSADVTWRWNVKSLANTYTSSVAVDHDSHPTHHVYYAMDDIGIVRVALDGTTKRAENYCKPVGDALRLINADGSPFTAELRAMTMDAFKTIYISTKSGDVYSFPSHATAERLPGSAAATPFGGLPKAVTHTKDAKQWEAKVSEQTAAQSFYLADNPGAWSNGHVRITRVATTDPHKLLAKDIGGASDPYAVFYVSDSVNATQRTQTVSNTLQPSWDLTAAPLSWPLTNGAVRKLRKRQLFLHVEMWDRDVGAPTDDFMGFGNVLLDPLQTKYTIPLVEYTKTHARPGGAIDLLIEFDLSKVKGADSPADAKAAPAVVVTLAPPPAAGAAAAGKRGSSPSAFNFGMKDGAAVLAAAGTTQPVPVPVAAASPVPAAATGAATPAKAVDNAPLLGGGSSDS